MGKSRIKNLRKITVGDEEYKWLVDDLTFKVWKDKKLIYDNGYKSDEKYPRVTYNLEGRRGSMTPSIVAKVIRMVTGVEKVYSKEDLLECLSNEGECGIGYYSRNATFEDEKTERLWAEFNDKYKELKEHLEGEKKV